jgi:hypothetical protein
MARTTQPFVVSSGDDFDRLTRAGSSWATLDEIPRLLIRLPGLSSSEARVWEEKLETLRQSCGCAAAAQGMAVFSLACAVTGGLGAFPAIDRFGAGGLAAAGLAFAAGLALSAVVARGVSLYVARLRYRRMCFRLIGRLHAVRLSA